MPVFNLELEFDDRGALKAAKVLDAVDISARKAEQGLKNLKVEAAGAAKGIKNAGDAAQDANSKIQKLSNITKTLKGAFAAIVAGVSVATITEIGKALLDASIALDRLDKAYQSIYGSEYAAGQQLDFVLETSRNLGLQFTATAEAAKTFFAAGQGTTIAGEMNDIFEAFSTAGTALNLSTDQMQGAFLALGQMISKGKVQAEELRGQLGERLPGAFQLAAKAMGMTTAELDKFMADGKLTAEELLPKMAEALKNEFAPAAEEAAKGVQQAINRMSTEWELFKASILNSDAVVTAINAVTSALEGRNRAVKEGEERQAAIEQMRAARIVPLGQREKHDVGSSGAASTIIETFYTDEQIANFRKAREELAKNNQAIRESEKIQADAIANGTKATNDYLKYTSEARAKALQDDRDKTLAAIDAQIKAYQEQGEDIAELTANKLRVEAEYQRRLAELNRKNQPKSSKGSGVSAGTKDQLAIEQALQKAREESAKDAEKLAQKEQENLQVRADFYRDLSQLSGDYGLSLEYQNQLIQQQAEDWIAAGVPQADVLRRIELMRQELARDPWSGFVRGARKWAAETQDLAKGVEQTLTNAFDGAADALANFVMTGKINFQSLANSIISDLARIAARQAIGGIVGGLVGGIGKLFGGFSWGGTSDITASSGAADSLFSDIASSEFHTGGMAWEKPDFTRSVPAALFADAPRFHNGRFYDPSYEIPAIIRRDESVLTPGQMRAIAGAGGTSHVTVNVVNQTSTPVEAEAQATPDGNGGFDLTMILREVDRGMVGLAKSGRSSFTQMIEKSYGLNRAGVLARGRR